MGAQIRGHAHDMVWMSEDNLRKSTLSFPSVGPRDQTQVCRFDGKSLYLSRLVYFFMKEVIDKSIDF